MARGVKNDNEDASNAVEQIKALYRQVDERAVELGVAGKEAVFDTETQQAMDDVIFAVWMCPSREEVLKALRDCAKTISFVALDQPQQDANAPEPKVK